VSDTTLKTKFEAPNDPALPATPFVRVRYLHGMLLGADDFGVEQRYHVVGARVHQALLHGYGTVRGLRVTAAVDADGFHQLKVHTGLAVDPLGRTLYVPQDLCLRLEGRPEGVEFEAKPEGDDAAAFPPEATHRAWVVLRYQACLSEEVIAIQPPCDDPANSVGAYSRVQDGYHVDLVAEPPALPPHLHPIGAPESIAAPPEDAGWEARNALVEDGERGRLLAWSLQSQDGLDRLWQKDVGDMGLALAAVYLAEDATSGALSVVWVDNSIRALLMPVQHMHEIHGGVPLRGVARGGVRVASIEVVSEDPLVLRVELDGPFDAGTVDGATELRLLAPQGWLSPDNKTTTSDATGFTLEATLPAGASVSRWRLLIKGTGASPLTGPTGGLAGRLEMPDGERDVVETGAIGG
jgi:hypothetical protein